MMTRFSTSRTFAATALMAALFAGAAIPSMAQNAEATAPAATAAPADAAQPGQHQRGKHERMTPEQRQERMAKRAEALKQKLKITPAQEGAWSTFQTAMHPADKGERAHFDRKEMEKLTTPERIDKMRDMRAKHNAEMDRRADATKAFYAQLNADQQKTFDAATLRMHRDHGQRFHRHHGGKPGQERPAPAPAVAQ